MAVSLPSAPSGMAVKAGSVVEVSWTIEANHAGGYQYVGIHNTFRFLWVWANGGSHPSYS